MIWDPQNIDTSQPPVDNGNGTVTFRKKDGSTVVMNKGSDDFTPGNILRSVTGPLAGAAGLGPAKQQPGVGGPAVDPSKLQQDPSTGLFYDPTTGTTYADATGQSPVTNPNLAQQVATNFATRTSLLSKLAGNRSTIDNAVTGQKQLTGNLLNTINNPNASSVAQSQLGIGADAIARQQMQQAAGATGANAFLARRNAANNIGNLQATLNGQTALTRANEVDAATGRLSTVLGNEATEGQAAYSSNLLGAVQFGGQAGSGEATQQNADTTADENTQNNKQKFASGILGAVSHAGTTPGA